MTHSVPEAEHEDGGDEGGDEQAPCHQQVDLPGCQPLKTLTQRKTPPGKLSQVQSTQKVKNISPDELAPHRCKVKGATKATSSLHLALAGLAVVEGAVRVPLLLLTTGSREIVVAASSSIPHLNDFQCQRESAEKSCIFQLLLPALCPWYLLGLASRKGSFTFREFLLKVTLSQQTD